ncbi:phospholipid carrier-dependent glycosyltransferase [Dyadobacter helix]|uniref:phospholipid carrier-dependent glycosyltransferase n=1 Tax=Dyadobacter helix TaxID=2822344 RepID=UPI001BFC0B8F|nr:phospholipid carrier-dependent glycosyltransferase [Dyadobacter sp. CECT 9275]
MGVDAHGEVINFILQKGRLPLAREVFCAMHPPLYYILALPFFYFDTLQSQKITQIFSLLLACGNLYLLFRLCKDLLPDILTRNVAFLLALFLHSFVTFSLYVSNDTLAYFIGTAIFYALHRYISAPTRLNEVIVAILLGLGLLTKGTFLAFAPPLVLVVLLSLWKRDVPFMTILGRVLLFGFVVFTLGCYKYLENYHAENRFVVHNLDFFHYMPANMYDGDRSIWYFNLKQLILNPTYFEGDRSLESIYPVLFYATFWYKFCEPFNGFELGSRTAFKYIGSILYMVGLVPSVLLLLGSFVKSISVLEFLKKLRSNERKSFEKGLEEAAWLSILFLSILLVIIAGYKYNVWVCFQSRLFLQSFFPIIWILYTGFIFMKERFYFAYKAGILSMVFISVLCIIYYLTEGIHVLMY